MKVRRCLVLSYDLRIEVRERGTSSTKERDVSKVKRW